MEKYEYKAVTVGWNMWTGKAKADYLNIINEYGEQGWRFIQIVPHNYLPKGKRGIELIFEKKY